MGHELFDPRIVRGSNTNTLLGKNKAGLKWRVSGNSAIFLPAIILIKPVLTVADRQHFEMVGKFRHIFPRNGGIFTRHIFPH